MLETNVSVIIPCLNEAQYLPNLLNDLVAQKHKNFEVLVVDDNSKDGTREEALKFDGALDIKVLSGPGKGVAAARNFGASRAQGEWLFFFDADVRLPTDFLINAVKEVNHRHLKLAGAPYRPDTNRWVDKFSCGLAFKYQQLAKLLGKAKVVGWCVIVKKSLHEAVGGFNESYRFGEDYEYSERAGRRGKFGFLHTARMTVSMRRYDQEGRLKMLKKVLLGELYRTFKPSKLNQIEYEFGKHESKK